MTIKSIQPNSFLITYGDTECNDLDINPIYHDESKNLKAYVHKKNEFYIRQEVTEDWFGIFVGERKDGSRYNQKLYQNPICGTSIEFIGKENKLVITSDITGSEIVYYSIHGSNIIVSNRLEHFSTKTTGINWKSVFLYLSYGYTLQEQTFYKSVNQIMPGEKIQIALMNNDVTTHKVIHSVESTESQDSSTNICPEKEISQKLTETLANYADMSLMMSAGWDSRLLIASRKSPIKLCYTHGDLSSRETAIAKKVSGTVRLDHIFKDVTNIRIDNTILDKMIREHGHCLWPIWHTSSQLISEKYDLPITSGVIGARLGGHNGILSIGTRYQRALRILYFYVPKFFRKSKLIGDIKKNYKLPASFWFTSNEANKLLSNIRNDIDYEIDKAIDKYLEKHKELGASFEFFNYNHISRQYMMKQPTMAKGFSGYYSPLSNPDLLMAVYRTPFHKRMNNALSKHVIRELNPALLNYPMAATLAKASSPILIQEMSRILRIFYEKAVYMIFKNKPSLGWFNYEHIYNESIFNDIIEDLRSDFWDKQRMANTLASNQANNIDAGSTLDMLCKIKTVDHYISLLKDDQKKFHKN